MSLEPFNRLVKLAARAFYDDITLKGENQPKSGRSDNRGMAVVVLDALTRRQWVREEDLAKSLKLHSKQLRRTLRFFEEEKLVTRDHRKETARGAKMFSAAVAATADAKQSTREGEEKQKMHTHSYCSLDYAQIYDVVRYRMHKMKKKLKDELENRNTIQEYICPSCKKRYSALDVAQLISPNGEYFSCERCSNELVAESDKLASEEVGDGDDNTRRRNREKLKAILQKIEEQLKPLTQQLARVKDLPVPEFGSLQSWEVQANVAARARNGDANASESSKSSHGQGGTQMPFIGETSVEVALSGSEVKGEVPEGDSASAGLKVLPPWMIKQGMVLTSEQRGEVKPDVKDIKTPSSADEKKPKDVKEDMKSIESEYYKAYYAELYRRQLEMEEQRKQEAEEATARSENFQSSEASFERHVGMKAKREEDEEDIEWEDTPVSGVTVDVVPKVTDLNIAVEEEEEAGGDDDDDIDWEEG